MDETVTCTFVNHELATIIVVKDTEGGDGEFDFTTTGGDELPTSFSITTSGGTGSETFENIDPDLEYSITESSEPGWDPTGASCTGTNSPGSITPNTGEKITCTFTNAKKATLTLIKILPNDNGGDAEVDDFQAYINGSPVPWGEPQMLSAGDYTASEDELFGYAAGDWDLDCAADGTITLAPGDDATCTITNDDIPAEIRGMKFEDVNGNGVKDDGEPGLPDWEINLDDGDSTVSTTTDADGNYSFTDLSVGTYTVTETPQADWMQTTSNPAPIELDLAEVVEDIDFGNFEMNEVTGKKSYTGTNVGLNGFTIFVDENSDGILNGDEVSDTTDTDGNFSLLLGPGVYNICEVLPAGWSQTVPASGANCVANGNGYALTVNTSGAGPFASNDFANRINPLPPISIVKKDFQKLSTIPVKFASPDGDLDPLLYVCPTGTNYSNIACVDAQSSGSSNILNQFRYDPLAQQYIYNLSTKMPIFIKGSSYDLWITLDGVGIGPFKFATIKIK